MDDTRFDNFVRLLGLGISRRQILKGLLGIGGAATVGGVAADKADARTIGARPTILPPPPPTTRPPATTTPVPCPGQQQCPDSALCCPTGTCARSGNQAICCTGTVCGFECCDSPDQCCDRECCATGSTCLTIQFPASDEEICCLAKSICIGSGAFATRAQCCGGETPDCCIRENGESMCIGAETQCCTDDDCPGDCAFCQENGFCAELDDCGPTTTTPAPVSCVDNADCTVEFQVCCDGVCEFNFVCNCKECVAAGDCSNTLGCCDTVEHCGEPESCQLKSCNQHICVSVTDCREPLGDERCCNVGLICNEESGSCEQDMSCDPPCSGEFIVCCDGECMENFRCNCKECIAAGDCSNTLGCCDTVEHCGEPESCQLKSCNQHICVSVTDCREPLGDERCCNVGLICNEESGSCEQDMSCDPPCSGEFIVCCDGECMENFRCNCKECIAAGDCSNTVGCCDTVEHCGEPESCQLKSCNQHICVSVTDCREPLGDERCCNVGLICNEETGSCQLALAASLELSEPGCPVCDAFPNSYCDKSTATCACAPLDSCVDGRCGAIDDGCGGLLDCGPCLTTPAPIPQASFSTEASALETCHFEGERCVSDDQCCVGFCRGRNCGDRGRKSCQAACAS